MSNETITIKSLNGLKALIRKDLAEDENLKNLDIISNERFLKLSPSFIITLENK